MPSRPVLIGRGLTQQAPNKNHKPRKYHAENKNQDRFLDYTLLASTQHTNTSNNRTQRPDNGPTTG